MNNFDLFTLQEIVLGDPSPTSASNRLGNVTAQGTLGRLEQLTQRGVDSILEHRDDFAPLLRQVLLETGAHTESRLRVPGGTLWPNREFWSNRGFIVSDVGSDFLLKARPWSPSWLRTRDPNQDIFDAAFRLMSFKKDASCEPDPFLEAAGFPTYSSPGQRDAVRSALLMPVGTTLIVNLPTGSGKSLVGHSPVILRGFNDGLTVFVVPTTALALDQERRLHEQFVKAGRAKRELPPLAYYSGSSQAKRVAIRENIKKGCQGIVFCSPESFTGSLSHSLYDAAAKGTLKYLVVDEAHIVAQWGDNFRPAFQSLAGTRRGLLSASPEPKFRTVLLSATLSSQTINTLYTVFGTDLVQMVSAVHLRPEPEYWAHFCQSATEKNDRILELVRHAPRPALLYLTERKEAIHWYGKLWDEGYRRIECFHGDTPDSERERIIQSWSSNQVDLIVATSAFGVGIDKADVRSVIHGAIPENYDRYYQEVGRGGRDGCASVAVLVYTEKDLRVARTINRPGTITGDYAFERWKAMYDHRLESEAEGLIQVELNTRAARIKSETDYNLKWNLRTLVLMARAGLIQIESLAVPGITPDPGESGDGFERRLEKHYLMWSSRMPVRTLDPQLLNPKYFASKVELQREASTVSANKSLDALVEALEGRLEMGQALAQLYRSLDTPGRVTVVSKVCRGCESPSCPREADYQLPFSSAISTLEANTCRADWDELIPGLQAQPVIVTYPRTADNIQALIASTLEALISLFAFREIVAPSSLLNLEAVKRIHRKAKDSLVFFSRLVKSGSSLYPSLNVPGITVFYPWESDTIDEGYLLQQRDLHLIIVPEKLESEHPGRKLEDTVSSRIAIEELLRRIKR